MKDGAEYDNLYAAATCRERADWDCGISATRLFSVLYGTPLNVGRVQSPTLALLCERDNAISNFVKEKYFNVHLNDMGLLTQIKSQSQAERIKSDCDGNVATVTEIKRTKHSMSAPKLYDLTTLQRHANRLYGFTAAETLEYAQSLYEKSLLSYPRSDSRYLTADMRDSVLKIIGEVDFVPNLDRIVGVISDHHAIIPTIESVNTDIQTLPSGERTVFELVRNRLTAAVAPSHEYEAITATIECSGYSFISKSKTIINDGWKAIERGDKDDDSPKITLSLTENQQITADCRISEQWTKPPPAHTEDSLLAAMEAVETAPDAERRGIGSPATRSIIIERAIKAGLVQRQKKNLVPTEKGKNLIKVLPESLTSAKLTANWEHRLKLVERGELSERDFMGGIEAFIKSVVEENNAPKPEFASLFGVVKNAKPSLGDCLRCGKSVREDVKGFFCDNRDCGFKLWKASKFWTAKKKPLTAAIVTALLKDGKVALKGLYSEKTGKTYSAVVTLDDSGGDFINYKLKF